MRGIICYEESGKVRDACIALGHETYSNDFLPARNGGPHLQMDAEEAIKNHGPWDFIILHPVCTRMTLSGNRWYGKGKARHQERLDAIDDTIRVWKLAKAEAKVGAILENPTSVLWQHLPEKVYYYQPWQFGHGEVKKTGFVFHNFKPLKPTNIVEGRHPRIWLMPPSPNRERDRSETFQGIADALALTINEGIYHAR